MPETVSDWRAFQALQRVIAVGDHFFSYLEQGAGEPVILIHGIPTWGYLWHRVMATLPR